jgi:hypothetical protein
MRVGEMLRVARESASKALSVLSPSSERLPALGAVVDDFTDVRLPARNDLGIEFEHIPRLGERSGFSMRDPVLPSLGTASHGLVRVRVASPSVAGFVVMGEGEARDLAWELERQVAQEGAVTDIPTKLFQRLSSEKRVNPIEP